MPRRFGTRRALIGGKQQTFAQYLASIPGALSVWSVNDALGSSTMLAAPNTAYNGSYTGVTLGQASGNEALGTAGLWDGVNDKGELYTATLAGTFNGAEGTVLGFVKMSGAGVWADGVQRWICFLQADANNYVRISKATGANTFVFFYNAAGTGELQIPTLSLTDWFMVDMTWSASGDVVTYGINGAASGSDDTGLGTWAGALASSSTQLGGLNAAGVHDGYLSHWAVYSRALTRAERLAIAQKAGVA